MTRSAETVRETAREFVKAVRPEDSLAMITFADQPVVEHAMSTNRQLTFDAIDKYKPLGGAVGDALWDALQQLKRVQGRRAIVVLTDGRDENNPGTGRARHDRRRPGTGPGSGRDDLSDRSWNALDSHSSNTWRRDPAARRTSRRFPRNSPSSSTASSRICGNGTCSVTRRRTPNAMARGATSKSSRGVTRSL